MKIAILATSVLLILGIAWPCGAFLFDPLSRHSQPTWIALAKTEELSSDGTPRRFPLLVPRQDAWTRCPDTDVGFVFVRRVPISGDIAAFESDTFSMGLPIEFDSEHQEFRDLCWGLTFDLDGRLTTPHRYSRPERLIRLDVKVSDGTVFVLR